ncbi:hypothetical protein D9M70_651190 [compost metagenome]
MAGVRYVHHMLHVVGLEDVEYVHLPIDFGLEVCFLCCHACLLQRLDALPGSILCELPDHDDYRFFKRDMPPRHTYRL